MEKSIAFFFYFAKIGLKFAFIWFFLKKTNNCVKIEKGDYR